MWLARSHADRRGGGNGLVAVAIDRDKGSQNALKWSIDHLVLKGQTLILLHVKLKPALLSSSASLSSPSKYFSIIFLGMFSFSRSLQAIKFSKIFYEIFIAILGACTKVLSFLDLGHNNDYNLELPQCLYQLEPIS